MRNFDKDVLTELRCVDFKAFVQRDKPSLDPFTSLNTYSTRKVSYKSADSFEKNKNGIFSDELTAVPSLAVDLTGRRPMFSVSNNFVSLLTRNVDNFQFDIQTRGFKTVRSVSADQKRNPNLINRLRKFC